MTFISRKWSSLALVVALATLAGGEPTDDPENRAWGNTDPLLGQVGTTISAEPELQRFRASYMGNFQQLVDDNCEGPPPLIQVFCKGNIKPLQSSHPSIDCETVRDEYGWNGIQCVNRCDGQSKCENVYLVKNGKSEGGVFGEIQFQCSGETQEDIRAYMSYLQGEPGKCKLGSPKSRNYHVGKLGVLCATDDGNSTYQYGNDLFHCQGGVFSKFGNSYACYTGDNCNGRPCKVDFEEMIIKSNSRPLSPKCMDQIAEEIPATPPPAEDAPIAEEGQSAPDTEDEQSALDTPDRRTFAPTATPTDAPTTLEPTDAPTTLEPTTSVPETAPPSATEATEPNTTSYPEPAPQAAPEDTNTTEPTPSTAVVETTNSTEPRYKVRYMGRFHQVMSPGCAGPKPRIMVVCQGDLEVTGTSHESIECFDWTFKLTGGKNAKYCENKCIGFECDMVYLSTEYAGNQGSPAFGQVYFTCSGDTVEDVDGAVVVPKEDPSFCDGSDIEGTSLTIAQLAIVCPTEDGLRYVIDDRHSECGQENDALRFGTYYSCSAGGTCGDERCEIDFKPLEVNADPHLFQECITPGNESTPVPELAAPTKPEREPGLYTTTFVLGWLTVMDSECQESTFTRRINCTNGRINIVESEPHDCTYVDESTIECSDLDLANGQVRYECTADSEMPETYAESISNFADCSQHTSTKIAWPALQLGIVCGDPEEVVISDWFAECGGQGAEFDVQENGTPFCYTAILIPEEATDRNFELAKANYTGKLEIMTDFRWSHYASQECFTQDAKRRALRGSTA